MQKPDNPQPVLRRDVGLGLFVLYGVGNIIGAGIYVLIGKVAGEAGLLAPFAFLLAAIIAVFSGLSYGELAARYPLSAGEAVYLEKAFRRKALSITVGLLIAFAGLVSAATMARGFLGYFREFVTAPDWLVVLILLVILTLIAIRGILQSARVAAALTLIEVGGLVWIVVVAMPQLPALVNLAELSLHAIPPLNELAWQGLLGGAFLAFFAFIGFEDMVNIAEEVKQPQKTIPRGILLAFFISTALYLVVSLVAIATIPPSELATSDAPLADVYQVATGRSSAFISLIGLVAVLNGALIQIIMASRIFYGMSRNKWLPKFLATINLKTQTPITATLVAGALTLLLALALPLVQLAKITSGIVLVVFVLINLSLIRIKYREPKPEGVRSLPIAVPVIGALASTAILLLAF